MPQSRKRKSRTQTTNRSGRQKALFLPMPRAVADKMMLCLRLALELVRAGQPDLSLANCLAQALVLTGFITKAGHGVLATAFIGSATKSLGVVLTIGIETGAWRFPPQPIDDLTIIVNEHDRQLREIRLDVVADASDRLELRFKQNESE